MRIEREWFISSKQGNIKEDYFFEKKLGSGGYGAVYLAKHKKSGRKTKPRYVLLTCSIIGMKVAVKAM